MIETKEIDKLGVINGIFPKKNPMHLSSRMKYILSIVGPGLVVMLADTDAGSIYTAAQSGAQFKYSFLLLQLILIPILIVVQELTVRLGIVTGLGHGELIRKHFGKFWAWVSISTLIICCIGAVVTEFSGIVSVGDLFGVSNWITLGGIVAFLLMVVFTGTYRSVEKVALFIGAFQLMFIVIAFKAAPSTSEIFNNFLHIPIHNKDYLYLVAANIGAVIMPWMVFYQQSAVIDKGLMKKHLKISRIDTIIGAVITQIIMAAVVVILAATLGKTNPGASLNSAKEISEALTPFLGQTYGKIVFSMAILGCSLIACIVATLAAAWGVGELLGLKHSLQHNIKEAPVFYGSYAIILILTAILVGSGVNLLHLSIAVEVMNSMLLPIVLGFLYLLAVKTLPENYKLKGKYSIVVAIIFLVTCIFGVYGGITGIFN